jgi:mannose-6-phosphate isomerase-like protein (cupin superfamily)
MSEAFVKRLTEAVKALPRPASAKWPEGEPYDCFVNQPGAQILVFAPRGTDHQTEHNRDEAYICVKGSATLEIGGKPQPFAAGDLAWVPKNVSHRFVGMSEDFTTWVAFFG